MTAETKIVEILGDANLSREEAITLALETTVSKLPRDQRPTLKTVKTFALHEGPIVTKVVHFWDIRDSNTGEVKRSTFKFQSLRRTNDRGWELEHHHSFSPGGENLPDSGDNPYRFLSSMNSVKDVRGYIVLDSEGIDLERLSDVLAIVSSTGKQGELLSRIFKWIHEDPQAHSRLTQLSSDDLPGSQSLAAAINYVRYAEALNRFKGMVERNAPEQDFQTFLEENHWLFGSEYSELIDKRTLVVGQQLDFLLRKTVDGYLEVIEIKTPLDGASGLVKDTSHGIYCLGSETNKSAQQVLNYLSTHEAELHQIKSKENLDVSRIRGKLIIGRDGCEAEQNARRLYNANSHMVEVISFDSLIRMGQRILDIMVEQNPGLLEMDSPINSIDRFNPDDLHF
ncbi:MAG: DUF4263 domain-containing protein [Gammaproteobacteria bacterium]|nr:DUF4263 domain-containing protein [Gammaproteobacteria bacterium]